jgi:transposase-like protein
VSTKPTASNREIEAALSSLFEVITEETAPLILNHLELSRQAALTVMQQQAAEYAGDRYGHDKPHDGRYSRWGSNPSSIRVGGQKLPVEVPRLMDHHQQRTFTPEVYHQMRTIAEPSLAVMKALLRGLGTRQYRETAEVLLDSFGLSKSALSAAFVEYSNTMLEEYLERRLDDEQYVALFIDGKMIQSQSIVVAIGITEKGYKRMVGLTHATTENASSIGVMLRQMVGRGLDFEQGLLVVLDGGKGLRKAVDTVFGHHAVVQRCQKHKERNVLDHLAEGLREVWARRLREFFACQDHAEARSMADAIHADLKRVSIPAARSFAEGIDEVLTLVRLGVADIFSRSFSTTNIVESVNSGIARFTRHITRWTDGNQRLRWAAMALMELEPNWNRVQNFKRLPMLQRAVQQEVNQRIKEATSDSKPNRISTKKRT